MFEDLNKKKQDEIKTRAKSVLDKAEVDRVIATQDGNIWHINRWKDAASHTQQVLKDPTGKLFVIHREGRVLTSTRSDRVKKAKLTPGNALPDFDGELDGVTESREDLANKLKELQEVKAAAEKAFETSDQTLEGAMAEQEAINVIIDERYAALKTKGEEKAPLVESLKTAKAAKKAELEGKLEEIDSETKAISKTLSEAKERLRLVSGWVQSCMDARDNAGAWLALATELADGVSQDINLLQ